MRTVEEIRRLRLLQLKEQFRSWSEINKLLEQDARDSTLSQCATQATGTRTMKPKSMGSALARRIEAVTGKPDGWMDNDPTFDGANLWPFELISASQVMGLNPVQRGVVEGAVLEALERLERSHRASELNRKQSQAA